VIVLSTCAKQGNQSTRKEKKKKKKSDSNIKKSILRFLIISKRKVKEKKEKQFGEREGEEVERKTESIDRWLS
jgi:hypothetical protein